ncbi:MAG: DEAD/DEAH box helicase [Candidatus Thorarchaeota archaeon]|nr:MAG: DEAD/DEAH box helicase [Candidatus Thorarchaeota archaeon]
MSGFELLDSAITSFLATKNLVKPTPIQSSSIQKVLDGDNVLLLAPTGTGKTEAALLPLVHRLLEMKKERELFGFYVLYITPLRALNRDVFLRIEELCAHLGLNVSVRHGDTTQYARRKQALSPPHILITTPETLQAVLPGKRLKEHLKSVFAIVVDEIHELADSKRGTQLSLGLERVDRIANQEVQRIGLSATVGNPKEVADLVKGGRSDVNIIWAGYDSRETRLRVESPVPSEEQRKLARTLSYPAYSTARLQKIVELIENHDTTLVFVNTRSFAEVLGSKMRALKPSFEFDVHHGSLSKDVRLAAEGRLKKSISKAIIATSSLELGIDIGTADLVIQYSSPREVSRALQRTGRAGHSVGMVSEGVILATANLDDITESGVILRRARKNKVERASIPKKTWDVLCHQISGIVLETGEIQRSVLMTMVKSAYPFSFIDDSELDRVLRFMIDRKIVKLIDDKVVRGPRSRQFYYEHLSTIPDVSQVKAVDIATRTPIGVLDESYVNEHLEIGQVFVIRGRPWYVVSIEDEELMCAPAGGTESDAPKWVGEMIPVPYEVATEVGELWDSVVNIGSDNARGMLKNRYGIVGEAQDHVIDTLKAAKDSLGVLPSAERVVIESLAEGVVLHVPLGTKANETLGILVASLLTTRMGTDVAVERDPYRVLMTSNERINSEMIVETIREYSPEHVSAILRLAMKRTQTFASRFIHVGKRMGIIRRDAKTKEIPTRRLIDTFEDSPVFEEAMREVLDEKLDEKRVLDFFRSVSEGAVEIHVVYNEQPSPLARLILEEKTRFEVMAEITEEEEVLRLLEDRLLSKRFRFVCMAKGDWNSVRTVSTLDNEPSCPVCGSKRLAATTPIEKGLQKIVRKALRGESLSAADMKMYKMADMIADLVSYYGRAALVVLAGRGVGPQTASRILKPGLTNRLDLLREIVAAEKDYARTRPFWD